MATELSEVKGVNAELAAAILEDNDHDPEKIKDLSIAELTRYPGVGRLTATRIQEGAAHEAANKEQLARMKEQLAQMEAEAEAEQARLEAEITQLSPPAQPADVSSSSRRAELPPASVRVQRIRGAQQ